MALKADIECIARAALAHASVPAAAQSAIVDTLYVELDRADAIARRNQAIRDAHNVLGNVVNLTRALHAFHANAWPHQRHLPAPPEASPLRRACWLACKASSDARMSRMPSERQIRNII